MCAPAALVFQASEWGSKVILAGGLGWIITLQAGIPWPGRHLEPGCGSPRVRGWAAVRYKKLPVVVQQVKQSAPDQPAGPQGSIIHGFLTPLVLHIFSVLTLLFMYIYSWKWTFNTTEMLTTFAFMGGGDFKFLPITEARITPKMCSFVQQLYKVDFVHVIESWYRTSSVQLCIITWGNSSSDGSAVEHVQTRVTNPRDTVRVKQLPGLQAADKSEPLVHGALKLRVLLIVEEQPTSARAHGTLVRVWRE